MAGLLPRGGAAWTTVARLVAVLAVLTGLALLSAPRCVDGMLPTEMPAGPHMTVSGLNAPMAHTSEGARPADPGSGPDVAPDQAGGYLPDRATAFSPGGTGGDLGGVLASCLVFLVVALVALVELSPPRFWGLITRAGGPAPSMRWGPLRAGPGGLARLCVLRI